MKQLTTIGIILNRINYGEADRILTLLTPDYGKLRVLAKGVRRVKSKMAGGIELFSISQVGFIKGRGDIGTLTATRLERHYQGIVKDLDRTMVGYEVIRSLDRVTEEGAEREFFDILRYVFEALDDPSISLEIIRVWFNIQILDVSGRGLNLDTDVTDSSLEVSACYEFDVGQMGFRRTKNGRFTSKHIKLLRLARSHSPAILARVSDGRGMIGELQRLLEGL